jgi:hypothetical protein
VRRHIRHRYDNINLIARYEVKQELLERLWVLPRRWIPDVTVAVSRRRREAVFGLLADHDRNPAAAE